MNNQEKNAYPVNASVLSWCWLLCGALWLNDLLTTYQFNRVDDFSDGAKPHTLALSDC